VGGADAGAGDVGGGGGSCPSDEKTIGILYITYVADGAVILDSAYKTGWSADKQRFLFSDGARDQGLLGLLANPQMLEGALGTAPSGPDPSKPEGEQLRQLQNKFKARFNRAANLFIENIYDAEYVAAAAIELAGTASSGAAVRDAVRKLQDPNGTHVQTGDWARIKDLIAQKAPINLDGASGSLDFDEHGDILPPYYYSIWSVKDGQIITVRVDTVQ
jgi:branched-chain amino acid transport system substrate-binding protein